MASSGVRHSYADGFISTVVPPSCRGGEEERRRRRDAQNRMTFRSQKLDYDRRILIEDEEEAEGGGAIDEEDGVCVRGLTTSSSTAIGMEKEEETEFHLVRALQCIGRDVKGQFAIPTPVCEVDLAKYEFTYGGRPSTGICLRSHPCRTHYCRYYGDGVVPGSFAVSDSRWIVYDADSEDEQFLSSLDGGAENLSRFEDLIARLEGGCDRTTSNGGNGIDESFALKVRQYCRAKKERTRRPLIPQICVGQAKSSANDPYVVFRKRGQKMQTRKKMNAHVEARYRTHLEMKLVLSIVLNFLKMVRQRELTKRNLALFNRRLFWYRLNATDHSNLPVPGGGGLFAKEPSAHVVERKNRINVPANEVSASANAAADDDESDEYDEEKSPIVSVPPLKRVRSVVPPQTPPAPVAERCGGPLTAFLTRILDPFKARLMVGRQDDEEDGIDELIEKFTPRLGCSYRLAGRGRGKSRLRTYPTTTSEQRTQSTPLPSSPALPVVTQKSSSHRHSLTFAQHLTAQLPPNRL